MITPQHKMELFSISYIGAIAGQAGVNYAHSSGQFDYGIDVEFKEVTKLRDNSHKQTGIEFHAQVKCTQNLDELKGKPAVYTYDLDVDNYNHLVSDVPGATKKILIIVHVPKQESERLTISDTNMVLKNKAYWLNLADQDHSENKSSVRIQIPKKNILRPNVIHTFFECVKTLERLDA